MVKVNVRWATINSNELYIIIEALLPLVSAIQPKMGVKITVENMGIEVSLPDTAVVSSNLLLSKSVAYFRKGKKAA
jgi:hypothetical protein